MFEQLGPQRDEATSDLNGSFPHAARLPKELVSFSNFIKTLPSNDLPEDSFYAPEIEQFYYYVQGQLSKGAPIIESEREDLHYDSLHRALSNLILVRLQAGDIEADLSFRLYCQAPSDSCDFIINANKKLREIEFKAKQMELPVADMIANRLHTEARIHLICGLPVVAAITLEEESKIRRNATGSNHITPLDWMMGNLGSFAKDSPALTACSIIQAAQQLFEEAKRDFINGRISEAERRLATLSGSLEWVPEILGLIQNEQDIYKIDEAFRTVQSESNLLRAGLLLALGRTDGVRPLINSLKNLAAPEYNRDLLQIVLSAYKLSSPAADEDRTSSISIKRMLVALTRNIPGQQRSEGLLLEEKPDWVICTEAYFGAVVASILFQAGEGKLAKIAADSVMERITHTKRPWIATSFGQEIVASAVTISATIIADTDPSCAEDLLFDAEVLLDSTPSAHLASTYVRYDHALVRHRLMVKFYESGAGLNNPNDYLQLRYQYQAGVIQAYKDAIEHAQKCPGDPTASAIKKKALANLKQTRTFHPPIESADQMEVAQPRIK